MKTRLNRRDIRLILRNPCSPRIHWRVVDHGPKKYWQSIAVVDGVRAYLRTNGWAVKNLPDQGWASYDLWRAMHIWGPDRRANRIEPTNHWPSVPVESLRRMGIRIAGVTV